MIPQVSYYTMLGTCLYDSQAFLFAGIITLKYVSHYACSCVLFQLVFILLYIFFSDSVYMYIYFKKRSRIFIKYFLCLSYSFCFERTFCRERKENQSQFSVWPFAQLEYPLNISFILASEDYIFWSGNFFVAFVLFAVLTLAEGR